MKKLYDIVKGALRRADDIQQCVEAIRELQQVVTNLAGPGLGRTTTGTLFVVKRQQAAQGGATEDHSGGTADDLDFTQGTQDTDTWTRDTDDEPVTVKVVTDIEYNTTDHKLKMRTRTLSYDRGGNLTAISAESDLTDITTAVECTC